MQLWRAGFACVFLLPVPGALPIPGQTVAQTPAPEAATNAHPPGTPKIENGTSRDRLLFALPNFQSVEDVGRLPPLTAGQKYKLVFRSAFDPVQYPWYAMLAGIGQATNSESSFGQGAAGYGKRYVPVFADGIMEYFMVGAILPSVLHQDPRFYQTSKGSFMHHPLRFRQEPVQLLRDPGQFHDCGDRRLFVPSRAGP